MKPWMKQSLNPAAAGAVLAAAFLAGAVGGGVLVAQYPALRQRADLALAGLRALAAPAPSPQDAENRELARELAKIESDAHRDVVSAQTAEAPGGRARSAPVSEAGSPLPAPTSGPTIAYQVTPTYPPLALGTRLQGAVEVAVVVDTQGRPTQVTASGGHPILQQAALMASRQWRFHPALRDGKPTPSDFIIHFDFKRV